jgi:hypothetical protein
MTMIKIDTKLLGLGLIATAMAAALPAVAAAAPKFVVLDNPRDPNFNQLLGISDTRIIVGYFGDGTVVPNNGYVLVPRDHYSVENFTNLPKGDVASQTQAIGINNSTTSPDIVGFYTDNNSGFTHGWLDVNGVQQSVDDPAGVSPNVTMPLQNLLGVNDRHQAAGFWVDNKGNEHGYVVQFNATATEFAFAEIPPSLFKGAVATQASNITDEELVCGFWTDDKMVSHGFIGRLGGPYDTFNAQLPALEVVSTQVFGCNNVGEIVGQVTDSHGDAHGFIFRGGRFLQYDAPGSSQTAEFGVKGTLINGINDLGDIVGFFSDGKAKVNGFVLYSSE